MPWVDPGLTLRWGPYAKPDPEEQTAIVGLTQSALGAGATGGQKLVTLRTAVAKIAPFFGIDDIDAALEALKKETEDDAKKALQKTVDTQKAMAEATPAKPAEPNQKTPPPAKSPPKS
jgi:hypothetical protein